MMCGITGTPGTGKTVIGAELARRGHTVVCLADTVGSYVTGVDRKRRTRIIDTRRWAAGFHPVNGFVEGHFAHLLACDRIVVLRCRPDVLKGRLALRGYPDEKIRENAEAEALDSCLIETVERYDPALILELDTTDRDVIWCADRIESFVDGRITADFGHLDWSSFLEVVS